MPKLHFKVLTAFVVLSISYRDYHVATTVEDGKGVIICINIDRLCQRLLTIYPKPRAQQIHRYQLKQYACEEDFRGPGYTSLYLERISTPLVTPSQLADMILIGCVSIKPRSRSACTAVNACAEKRRCEGSALRLNTPSRATLRPKDRASIQ